MYTYTGQLSIESFSLFLHDDFVQNRLIFPCKIQPIHAGDVHVKLTYQLVRADGGQVHPRFYRVHCGEGEEEDRDVSTSYVRSTIQNRLQRLRSRKKRKCHVTTQYFQASILNDKCPA